MVWFGKVVVHMCGRVLIWCGGGGHFGQAGGELVNYTTLICRTWCRRRDDLIF